MPCPGFRPQSDPDFVPTHIAHHHPGALELIRNVMSAEDYNKDLIERTEFQVLSTDPTKATGMGAVLLEIAEAIFSKVGVEVKATFHPYPVDRLAVYDLETIKIVVRNESDTPWVVNYQDAFRHSLHDHDMNGWERLSLPEIFAHPERSTATSQERPRELEHTYVYGNPYNPKVFLISEYNSMFSTVPFSALFLKK